MEQRITALRVQKHNPQRVNVELDGAYAFGLARIVAAWLQVGQTLDEAKIASLKAEDAREIAYQQALRLLSYRPRTKAEIRKKLKDHNIPEETIDQVMERLERAALIDDARFAQNWVANRSEFRPRSRRALAFELQQLGADRQVIDDSLENIDDAELAYQAASKHARKLQGLDWNNFRQKMVGYLARRGFTYADCSSAIARVWAEITPLDDKTLEEVDK